MVELIVVLAIIGVILSITLPALSQVRASAARVQCRNNLRSIALALVQFDVDHRRLPASGNYFDPEDGSGASHHSWAVSILPWIEQGPLYDRWDLDKPITDPINLPLTKTHIPVYTCPTDISGSTTKDQGDLSYVVNGGVGFTVRISDEVGDCPIAPNAGPLDLNGDGQACPVDPELDATPSDRTLFKYLGLFFLENWKSAGTVRHYTLGDVSDGASQTFMAAENVRAGYDPDDAAAGFATPDPHRSAFYIGNPCPTGSCVEGEVDYSLANAGAARINSGLLSPEGKSAVPNSFHVGGVHMAFADGRVTFLSARIEGAVYAALASPRGLHLAKTTLEQVIVSEGSY